MKTIRILVVLVLLVGLFAGCTKTEPKKILRLYTWEGMFPQEVLDAFTRETGYAVQYSNFDTDENMLTKLEAAKGGDYDLVIADDYIIQSAIAKGLAQKLSKAKLVNFGNINPLYQSQFYDPSNEYTVPYGAGILTIMYDPALTEKPITSYADLFDPSLRGKVGLIGNNRVINGMVLKTMGQSFNTEDLAVIAQAGEKLLTLAPNVRVVKDDSLENDLISGEVAAAVMYTSQVTKAKQQKPSLQIVFPSEGIGFGIMAGFVPAKAPDAAAAHSFMNYILRPEVSAECFAYLGYYCTTKPAEALLSEENRAMLIIPANFSGDMEMIQAINNDAADAHDAIWNAFLSAMS